MRGYCHSAIVALLLIDRLSGWLLQPQISKGLQPVRLNRILFEFDECRIDCAGNVEVKFKENDYRLNHIQKVCPPNEFFCSKQSLKTILD